MLVTEVMGDVRKARERRLRARAEHVQRSSAGHNSWHESGWYVQ